MAAAQVGIGSWYEQVSHRAVSTEAGAEIILNRADILPRRLGVASLVLIVIAFNSPIATMAGFAQLSIGFGNGIGAPVSFLIAGAILLTFSVGFINMSRFIDDPGAFYRFIVVGIGKPPGLAGAFLAAAAYIFLCAGSYPYMGLIAIDLMTRLTGGPVLPWQAWTLIFVIVITVLGLLRIDLSIKLLSVLVCLEVLLVAIWEAIVFFRGGPEGYSIESYTPAGFLSHSPGLGVLFAMLCMIGIESAVCFRAEAINPEKSVGRATYIATAFLAVFYSIGAWAYIITQGASHAVQSATSNPVGSFVTSVDHYLGGFFVTLTSMTVVTSMMVSINAIQSAAARYLFSLGRDGVLPRALGSVHRRLQSPYVAVLGVALISLAILLIIFCFRIDPVASYAGLTGMGIYFFLPLWIATGSSILVFYRKNRHIQETLWVRLIAPFAATILLTILFVITSMNLKLLVSSHAMVVASMLGVVLIPIVGVAIALFYRKWYPNIYRSI